MATYYAQRANKVLKISEGSIERYLTQGYNITDASGNLVKKGTPRDAGQLTAEYTRQAEEIKVLKNENASLLAEVKALKAEIIKLKVETPLSAEPEAKTTTRRRKQQASDEVAE